MLPSTKSYPTLRVPKIVNLRGNLSQLAVFQLDVRKGAGTRTRKTIIGSHQSKNKLKISSW